MLLFMVVIVLQSAICRAGSYLLVKSGDGEIYSRFQIALSEKLNTSNQENTLVTRNVSEFTANPDTARFTAVVSAGIEASMAISKTGVDNRAVMAMLPKASYTTLSASGAIACKPAKCSVIYLDQPVARQLKLIRAALPYARMITVIGSEESSSLREQIAANAPEFGFRINNILAGSEPVLLNALRDELVGTDVLMAIPDPLIYNSNTARAILLSTFHQRIPLFAYSRSFMRAGATFGIYSSPEEIAAQVAELICCNGKNKAHVLFPKYFTIDVNQHTTEALGISIQNADSLKKILAEHGKE